LKKRRREFEDEERANASRVPSSSSNAAEPARAGVTTLARAEILTPNLPPPEKVVQAFAVLDLPITHDLREFERKARKMMFRTHPDKVNPQRRWQAAQEFKRIGNAREVILAWLREGGKDEDSEDELFGNASDEESNMGDAGGAESGSVSDEAAEELQACGIEARSMSRSPSPVDSDEESDQGNGAELVVETGGVRSDNRFSLGTTAPSTISTLRQQARALNTRQSGRTCAECFSAKPLKGKSLCSECSKELGRLTKLLGGGVAKASRLRSD